MAHFDYLKALNSEQREAVEYGVAARGDTDAGPLLGIAGAGTGKTKTLAHWVAHLVVKGVDPQRILLLTFSRRAAEEMIRWVERITSTALGTQHIELPWSGTFHSVGLVCYANLQTRLASSPHSRSSTGQTPRT